MPLTVTDRTRARIWLDSILDAPPQYEDIIRAVFVILEKSAQFIQRETNQK